MKKTRYEYSAGVVVFKREDDGIKFLVIKSCTGVYGYPTDSHQLRLARIAAAF